MAVIVIPEAMPRAGSGRFQRPSPVLERFSIRIEPTRKSASRLSSCYPFAQSAWSANCGFAAVAPTLGVDGNADFQVVRVPVRGPESGRCLSCPLPCVPPCGQRSDLDFVTAMTAFPPGITLEGATPKRGGKVVDFGVHHLPSPVAHQRQKSGGRSLHFIPLPCSATTRRARRGRTRPAPHYALPQRTRAIRANPCPMRIPGHNLDHNGEGGAPSESGALGLLKGRATTCATSMRHPPFCKVATHATGCKTRRAKVTGQIGHCFSTDPIRNRSLSTDGEPAPMRESSEWITTKTERAGESKRELRSPKMSGYGHLWPDRQVLQISGRNRISV